ncbi:hypothetical protein EJV47_21715 [Hymenobacter gummosus]|uniref:Uncharacterized protein n=1 Tax=Hymenobacter gummosus TaxID=1776032 RepID=A0A3S0H6M5_9BACT|nr:hypothetical protein [Hymenobacter gummosus]RTQ46569.1 hypothetical protein EJV47_21715 [Hymenobacter gummosus]
MKTVLLTWLLRPLLPAALTLTLLPSCLFPEPEVQQLPQYELSLADQAWAVPYRLGEEWRFHNAEGYERRYQVKGLAEQQLPGMVPGTQRVGYYQQGLGARLERVDSAYVERPAQNHYQATFSLTAAVPTEPTKPLAAQLNWGPVQLSIPAGAINQQQALPVDVRLLPTITLGNRQYQNVLEYTSLQTSAARVPAWQVQRLYYTKANGVVRFVEAGGTVWDRQ